MIILVLRGVACENAIPSYRKNVEYRKNVKSGYSAALLLKDYYYIIFYITGLGVLPTPSEDIMFINLNHSSCGTDGFTDILLKTLLLSSVIMMIIVIVAKMITVFQYFLTANCKDANR